MKAGLIFAGIVLGCAALRANELSQTIPPDVYLVTIDTLRADHVHCYGYRKIATPAIDELASAGVRFLQAFTPSPLTNTSHTTILTGLLPSSHGVRDFGVPLAASHQTLAQMLTQHGYWSAAFIGAVVLDSRSLAPGLERGFVFYDNFPEHSPIKDRWGRVERRGSDVVKHAETWITAHPRGPHFVWIHLYDPHDPYEPPSPYSEIYKDHLYDGEIAYADASLANFLRYLKMHGLYDTSIVIVVGDHGEGLGEHHEETHGIFLYDSTLHVPFIVKLPQNKHAGSLVDAQVRTTDIVPTVLDLVGAPTPQSLDGSSLKTLFTRAEYGERIAFSETDYPLRFGWSPLHSVRENSYKFIEAPRPELYNLAEDPTESRNAYEPWSDKVKRSRILLAGLRPKIPPQGTSVQTAGQQTLSELRALGYLGHADANTSTNVPELSPLLDAKDSIDEQNLLHRAMLEVDAGSLFRARRDLQKVLKLNPASSIALQQVGEIELRMRQYARAAEHLKAASAQQKGDSIIEYETGEALEKLGQLLGARDALVASLRTNPGNIAGRILLGNVYLKLKNLVAAADEFEAALLLDPKNPEARAGRVRTQARAK